MLYRYLFLPPGMEQENISFFFMLLRGKRRKMTFSPQYLFCLQTLQKVDESVRMNICFATSSLFKGLDV